MLEHTFSQNSDTVLSAALKAHGLWEFSDWWSRQIDWIEAPNRERGGWSGVGKLAIQSDCGKSYILYVKRQQNHCHRSWRHPIKGIPTFNVEFDAIRALSKLGIGVPKIIFFGCYESGNDRQAVLVTLELEDCQALDTVFPEQLNSDEQTLLILQLGRAIRLLHNAGWQHRALYPKHLFVRLKKNKVDVVFIDLEKSRRMFFVCWQKYADLIPLLHRLRSWPPSISKQLFLDYCGEASLSVGQQIGWFWIQRHLKKRHKH